jgi:hypothetical protein
MKTLLSRRALILAVVIGVFALPASASAVVVNPDMTWSSPANNQFVGNTLIITGTSANVDVFGDYYIDGTDGPHPLTADPSTPRLLSTSIDTSQWPEGPHTVQGHAFPMGGAIDGTDGFSSFYKTIYIEHSIPDLTFQSDIADGASTATDHFSWTFNSIDAGAYRCSIDGAPDQACSSPVSLTNLANGQHSFYVYARDQAHNESAPQGVTFTVNSAWAIPPETTFTSKPEESSPVTAANFAFESTTATTFECSLDGAAYAPCTSPHTVTGVSEGAHSFSVRGTDPTGQVELTPETTSFNAAKVVLPVPVVVPAPIVSGVGGKAKKLSVRVSGPGTIAAKIESCAKKKGKKVCKTASSGTATATAAGKLTISIKKALKKDAKYRVTFTSTSTTGATAKSVAKFKAK